MESWLALQGSEFERFIGEICGWGLDDTGVGKSGVVVIPVNKENEAKGTVVRENVQFDRKSLVLSLPSPETAKPNDFNQSSQESSRERTSSPRKLELWNQRGKLFK